MRHLEIISTHSLTRRLTADRIKSINFAVYFNSQPHKEADFVALAIYAVKKISTHSLTRRLTRIHVPVLLRLGISTHSLTRRLTLLTVLKITMVPFQLTASQGG